MSSEQRDHGGGRRDDRGGRQGGQGGGRRFIRARKSCRFCADKVDYIDYKDGRLLGSYIPERGTATASSNRSMSVSVDTPSDCAWKFVSTRWRSTGCAMARMSSKLTW